MEEKLFAAMGRLYWEYMKGQNSFQDLTQVVKTKDLEINAVKKELGEVQSELSALQAIKIPPAAELPDETVS